MTVNSLSNLGVPGLSGDRNASLAPVFTNRYRVLFFNFGATNEVAPVDLTRQCIRIGQPNVTFDIADLWSYVSVVYVNSRAQWGELSLTFRDDIRNQVMSRVQNQIAKQMNFFDQTMARAGENYKFEMDLDLLAGGASAGGSASDPNIIRKWAFAGCQLVGFQPSELAWQDANPAEIPLTIRFDNVIGFDQNGRRMGTYSHSVDILSRIGQLATGIGLID